ncbi:unnamed protein product, partial [marine sediment metagenome]
TYNLVLQRALIPLLACFLVIFVFYHYHILPEQSVVCPDKYGVCIWQTSLDPDF